MCKTKEDKGRKKEWKREIAIEVPTHKVATCLRKKIYSKKKKTKAEECDRILTENRSHKRGENLEKN